MKLLKTVLFALIFVNTVTAQEKVKEVNSYKTQSDVKIKTGMFFTILEGNHYLKEKPNFWKIEGMGKLSTPLEYFSFLNTGENFLIERILKVTRNNKEKQYLIAFKSDKGTTYLYVDDALKDKEIEILKSFQYEAIVKL